MYNLNTYALLDRKITANNQIHNIAMYCMKCLNPSFDEFIILNYQNQ